MWAANSDRLRTGPSNPTPPAIPQDSPNGVLPGDDDTAPPGTRLTLAVEALVEVL